MAREKALLVLKKYNAWLHSFPGVLYATVRYCPRRQSECIFVVVDRRRPEHTSIPRMLEGVYVEIVTRDQLRW